MKLSLQVPEDTQDFQAVKIIIDGKIEGYQVRVLPSNGIVYRTDNEDGARYIAEFLFWLFTKELKTQ